MKTIRAFTLIELLVVITIIGTLATVVTINYVDAKGKARYTRVISDMTEIRVATEDYKRDKGFYPCDVNQNTFPDNSPGAVGDYACPNKAVQTAGSGDGGLNGYLSAWILPPIKNAWYDWDYWTSGSSFKARVAMRKTTDLWWEPAPAFLCVYSTDNINGCHAVTGGTDPAVDQDIETMTDKSFPASY